MKKTISFFLALLMLLCAFCACADSADTVQEQTTEAETQALAVSETTEAHKTAAEESTQIKPNIGDVNFNNYIFRVLTRGTSSSTWYSRDIYSECITGDMISDAVYKRNASMESKYGFKVEEVGSKQPATDALTSLAAGDDTYSMLCFKVKDDITSILLKGYLLNLNNVSKMDLDQPYYDQNSRAAFSFVNKLYLVTGDLLTMDNDATRCMLFNKSTFNDLSLSDTIGGTLYSLTDSGVWTFETLQTCARIATSDANGDGVMNTSDYFGMVSEQFNVLALYNASGHMIYEKNAEDVPEFMANTDESLTIFSEIVTLLNGDYCRHYSNGYNEAIPQFKEGLVLFYPCQLADVPLLRGMEFDFGIIPLPKYSKDQESYCSTVTTYGSNCIAIPTTVKNVDTVASIIEVLSCESMYVVTPQYFELNLKSKLARDAESAPSIDIILKTACFELGYMWNWGNVYGAITGAFNSNNPNLASSLKTVEKAAKKEIEKNVTAITGFTN